MKWLKQYNKPNCGQIALAVITKKSVRQIYKLIGHDHNTKTKELAKVLRKLGYKCPNRLKIFKEKPKLAIGKLCHKLRKHNWHWVVIYNNKIYDGVNGTKNGNVKWKRGYKITSYLAIKRKD